jgi:hypothetical protein
MNHLSVSTHAPKDHLSRLGQYRLKDAARRRDRVATTALRKGEPGNDFFHFTGRAPAPALAKPFDNALAAIKPRWLQSIADVARRLARG